MDTGVKEEKIVLRKLTASDGHTLTNGEAYGKEIWLGKNDNADNWHEITDAEYEEYLKTIETEMVVE
jgi:hypothetical protein